MFRSNYLLSRDNHEFQLKPPVRLDSTNLRQTMQALCLDRVCRTSRSHEKTKITEVLTEIIEGILLHHRRWPGSVIHPPLYLGLERCKTDSQEPK